MPTHADQGLSEPPDEKTAEAEIEKTSEDARERDESASQHLAALDASVQAEVNKIEISSFVSPALDLAQSATPVDPKVAVNDPTPQPRVEAARKKRDSAMAAAAKEAKAAKDWNIKRFCAFIGIGLAAGGIIAAVYESAHRSAHGQGGDDLPLDPKTQEDISTLIDSWQKDSDARSRRARGGAGRRCRSASGGGEGYQPGILSFRELHPRRLAASGRSR